MSVLGVLYKVDGFPSISSLDDSLGDHIQSINSLENEVSSISNDTVKYVAVPVGVNLTRVQTTCRPPKPAECCVGLCLSNFSPSQMVCLKKFYRDISSKSDQMNYLKSLIRSVEVEVGEEQQQERTFLYLVPIGQNQFLNICKSAFRKVFGVAVKTIDALQSRVLQEELPHESIIPPPKPVTPSTSQAVCETCQRCFASKYRLTHHKTNWCGRQRLAAKKCQFQGCSYRFHHTTRLATHMREVHSAAIEPERLLKFVSYEKFLNWKQSEESRTFSLFTQNTGTKQLYESRVSIYVCQRFGKDRAHVRSDQPARKTNRRRTKGRVKSNMTCVAYMKVERFDSGEVRVLYSPTHSHPLKIEDTVNHPITPKIKAAVEEKLQQGYTAREIITTFKNQTASQNISTSKAYIEVEGHLVNQRIVNALARGAYPSASHFHATDAKSTEMLVDQLKSQHPSPILLSNIMLDNFILVLQQASQRAALLQNLIMKQEIILYVWHHEHTEICGLEIYSAIIDNEVLGYIPIGSCLSNLPTSEALSSFFFSLGDSVPNLWDHPVALVVHPHLAYPAKIALNSVKPDGCLLLSIRHTLSTMHDLILETVRCTEKQEQLIQFISRLVIAKDKSQFLEEVKTLKVLCTVNADSTDFFKQYEKQYLSRPTEWALFIRKQYADSLSSMHSCEYGESFSNLLSEFHQTRFSAKRVDELILSLLEVIDEYYTEKSQLVWEEEILKRQSSCISDFDFNSYEISDTCLPQQWSVKSQSEVKSHIVTATKIISLNSIPDRLDYFCTCSDPLPLCHHVLAVHALHHGSVSNILVPEPVLKSKDLEFMDAIVINFKQEVIDPKKLEDLNSEPVTKCIPNIYNISKSNNSFNSFLIADVDCIEISMHEDTLLFRDRIFN